MGFFPVLDHVRKPVRGPRSDSEGISRLQGLWVLLGLGLAEVRGFGPSSASAAFRVYGNRFSCFWMTNNTKPKFQSSKNQLLMPTKVNSDPEHSRKQS